jgi:predicted RNase H-like HicB family nuclease
MTLEEYVNLPWTWQFEEDPEDPGTIIATIAELEDFMYGGDSIEECRREGRITLELILEDYLGTEGMPLPPGVTLAASQSPDQ